MLFIKRMAFALGQAKAHRGAFAKLHQQTEKSCDSILDIDPVALKKSGIKALAIDYDGVLAGHDAPNMRPYTQAWLQKLLEIYPPEHVFILSNKPSEDRKAYFKKHFPGVGFVRGQAKKPYPDGLLWIVAQCQIEKNQLLMIDDRLLTGVLAALIAKCSFVWIKKPYTNYHKRPLVEGIFFLLRKMERALLL